MDALNTQQRSAAEAGDGPMVIIAGPGTGKTKTLIERIRFLIARGVEPAQILALTFTKKAAQEMAARFTSAVGGLEEGNPVAHSRYSGRHLREGGLRDRIRGVAIPRISTFHGLCFDLLKEKLGELPPFVTESARLALIKKLSKPAVLKGISTRELGLLISRAKNMADDQPDIAKLVRAYNIELATQNLCDFDDLLVRMRDLLATDGPWRHTVQQRFSHILVDEFQDTNALQYTVLQLLRGTDNVFAIGDPLQSIYGFRGADGDIFARFDHDFPHAAVIHLATNYRSAPQIVALANAVYPDNPALLANTTTPGRARVIEVLNEYSEANWVLSEIQKAIGGSDLQRAVSDDDRTTHRTFSDFAVLYRNRSAARAVQKAFADSGIPFQVVGEGSPYDEPAVQTIIQLLGRHTDPERLVTVKDMNEPKITALLGQFDAAIKPIDMAQKIATLFGYELTTTLRQFFGTLVRFARVADAIAYIDDIAAQNFYDPRADAVTLLTIHAAKGLEFAQVFVVAAEEGILPSAKGDEAEEQRLFYVAVTRAKVALDVLHAQYRGGQRAAVSRFVGALPQAVLVPITDEALSGDRRRTQKRQAKRAQISLF